MIAPWSEMVCRWAMRAIWCGCRFSAIGLPPIMFAALQNEQWGNGVALIDRQGDRVGLIVTWSWPMGTHRVFVYARDDI